MVENEYLDFLGIIGYELEFLIENNDVLYYTCEVERHTEYVEIFAAASHKDYTLTGDIGIFPLHQITNTFTIELLENDVLLKTFDLSVVVKNYNRGRQKKEADRLFQSLVKKDVETEDTQEMISHWETEETICSNLQELPQEPIDLELEKKQAHITPPRLLRLNVINGVLEPEFQADLFEYHLKRKKNKDRIVIKAEGERADYIINGDLGGQKLSGEKRTFCIRCSSHDHSLEMVYRLHVNEVTKKVREEKGGGWRKRHRNTAAASEKAAKDPKSLRLSKNRKVLKMPKVSNVLQLQKILIFSVIVFIITPCFVFRKPFEQIILEGERKNMEESLGEGILLEILDTWKKEVNLEHMEVTLGHSNRGVNAPRLSPRVSVEAEGGYAELLHLYGITHESYKNIVIDHLELMRRQENAQAENWLMRFDLVFIAPYTEGIEEKNALIEAYAPESKIYPRSTGTNAFAVREGQAGRFDGSGCEVTGWHWDEKKKLYCLGEAGTRFSSCETPEGYCVNEDGIHVKENTVHCTPGEKKGSLSGLMIAGYPAELYMLCIAGETSGLANSEILRNGDRGCAYGVCQLDYRYDLVDFMKFAYEIHSTLWYGFKNYLEYQSGSPELKSSPVIGDTFIAAMETDCQTAMEDQLEFMADRYWTGFQNRMNADGFSLDQRNAAVCAAMFSVNVNCGPKPDVFLSELSPDMTDEELIRGTYRIRNQIFSKQKVGRVLKGTTPRYLKAEPQMALDMLYGYTTIDSDVNYGGGVEWHGNPFYESITTVNTDDRVLYEGETLEEMLQEKQTEEDETENKVEGRTESWMRKEMWLHRLIAWRKPQNRLKLMI